MQKLQIQLEMMPESFFFIAILNELVQIFWVRIVIHFSNFEF